MMYTVHTHFTSDNREEAVEAGDLPAAVRCIEGIRDALLAQMEWELLSDAKYRVAVLYNRREREWAIITVTRSGPGSL
jgi:hypothetical protein